MKIQKSLIVEGSSVVGRSVTAVELNCLLQQGYRVVSMATISSVDSLHPIQMCYNVLVILDPPD